MTSTLRRYKNTLLEKISSWFPRTTLYLKGRDSVLPAQPIQRKRTVPSQAKTQSVSSSKPKHPQRRIPKSRAKNAGIYEHAFKVRKTHEQAMRTMVDAAVAKGILQPPSIEQWKMILSKAPTTRVFAGAGSGKSSTLLLRVVFMLCHLQIAREEITVVSFTKASCEELRGKLEKILRFWDYPLQGEECKKLVRTFHSALAQIAQSEVGQLSWFEQMGSPSKRIDDIDNDFSSGAVNSQQRELLHKAYERCYQREEKFRQRIGLLLEINQPLDGLLSAAPLSPFLLNGEHSAQPLPDLFFLHGSFAETLGIRISGLRSRQLSCSGREQIFLEAMQQFWRYLHDDLRQHRLITFNAAFAVTTDKFKKPSSKALATRLSPFTHLLVDEFQDISPQIVSWLRQIQYQLAFHGAKPSLMAIGDDWQSIYGWRGSSPEILVNFDHWFACKDNRAKSLTLMMENNYRSNAEIVADGEKILAQVRHKKIKQTQSIRQSHPAGHGVKVIDNFDLHHSLPRLLADITEQLDYAKHQEQRERYPVIIMSRTNAALKMITPHLDPQSGIRTCTIHRAKGLQAEVAIILDDGQASQPHPLRNALYEASGHFQQTYDEAMADETLRLSYVAVTRGVSRVLWYTRMPKGAAALFK